MHEITRWVENNMDKFYTFDPAKSDCCNNIIQKRKKEELIDLAQSIFRQKSALQDNKIRCKIQTTNRKGNKNKEIEIDKEIQKNI